jgi:hypothetical protein
MKRLILIGLRHPPNLFRSGLNRSNRRIHELNLRHICFMGFSALALTACVETTTTYTTTAQNRNVTVINNTGQDIIRFYGSNAGTQSWEEDILGQGILPRGRSVNINFNDGTGACTFDFKAELASGNTREAYGIDVCRVSSVTIN